MSKSLGKTVLEKGKIFKIERIGRIERMRREINGWERLYLKKGRENIYDWIRRQMSWKGDCEECYEVE